MEFILHTKLAIPVPRERLIARTRLYQRLEDGLGSETDFQRKLTLVVAPAGYGKTTLVAGWLRAAGRPFAWLSLDEQDNDPARFLAYILAALVEQGVGDAARKTAQSPQPPPPEVIISLLLNEIAAAPRPLTLVLDDYHNIHSPPIHQLMSFFLERQPTRIHLVIITREDPLLPVPRLRAHGQAIELRQDDLQFTANETRQFLCQVSGLDLAADEINLLEERTEGWIAGLQLAALAVQGLSGRGSAEVKKFLQTFAGTSRFILDYLMTEVFQQQNEPVQDFLLKTAVLDRMCAPLCDSLTGRADGQVVLEQLEKANLFIIPLDQAGEWFRYHHLFAEFLQHRLRVQSSADLPGLHLAAGQWYQARGYFSEAIEHALASRDWVYAGELIELARDGMLRRGEIAGLLNDYRRLPEEIIQSSVPLALGYSWPLLLSGQHDRAEALMNGVQSAIPPGSPTEGNYSALRAYLARAHGDHAAVINASEKALALLEPSDPAVRGTLAVNLGIAYWHNGRLDDTEQIMSQVQRIAGQTGNMYALLTAAFFRIRTTASRGILRRAEGEYLQLLEQSGQTPITALIHFDLATLLIEWNRLEEAEDHVRQGMEISARTGNSEFLSSGNLLQSMIHLAHRQFQVALQEAEQALRLSATYSPAVQARSQSLLSHINLAAGNIQEAGRWVEQMQTRADAHPLYRFLDLTRPRLFLAQNHREEARQLLLPACQVSRQNGWGYGLVAALVLLSLTSKTAEDAASILSEALQFAQPEGYLQVFLDAGSSLAPVLKDAARRGNHPEYVGQILALMENPLSPRLIPGLAEPLSGRELEVLRLVAAGLSNREIARQLVVTLGTAKTHIHNICGKLGVRNRTEASMRARELGLV